MKKEIAEKILNETENGYDLISKKFSDTRKIFWTELEFIRQYSDAESNVLDFGCGSGRLLELFPEKKVRYYGMDVSQKLIDIAKNKHQGDNVEFFKINPSQNRLAFESDFFNTVYSIATFHHIPSDKLRKEMAEELFRVMKRDGYVIVTVWNLWQRKYIKNILKNWKDKFFGKSNLDWNDCYISFTDNDGNKFNRYHHVWTRRELKKVFQKAGFKMEKCEIIKNNIIFVGVKK